MKSVFNLCAVAALICLLVVGAGAVTVTVDKYDYKSGEIISSHVADMTDGTNFSMTIRTDQFMKPGMPSAFGNTNISWPFAHKNDSFNLTNVNTTQNSVIIGHWWPAERGGMYEEAVFNGTSVNGVFTRTYDYEFDQTGNYTSKWIATPVAGASIVTSIFQINGTKISGPADFTANSSITTVNPAVAWVEIYADNTLVSRERYTIDAIDVPANLVPTLLPGSDGGSESYPGSSGAVTTTSSGSGSGSGATMTPTSGNATATGTATPDGTATPETTETGAETATTTTPAPAGTPFAFAALGALGCAALLLAGRARR